MTPDEAPLGTLCAVGHPANGVVARKERLCWRKLNDNQPVTIDDMRMLILLWKPEHV